MAAMLKRRCKYCGAHFEVNEPFYNSQLKQYGDNACSFCCQRCVREWRKKQSHETRVCKVCGLEFSFKKSTANNGRESRGQVCSVECRNIYKNKTITRICANCGIAYKVSPSKTSSKYCGIKCAGVAPNKIGVTCRVCGKNYKVIASRENKTKCCSLKCAASYFSTNNTRKVLSRKTRFYHKSWIKVRNQAVIRDGNRCVVCGETRGLVVHHIVPWKLTHDDSLINLVTLCRCCHIDVEYLGVQLPTAKGGALT